jgi:hypothetical protein
MVVNKMDLIKIKCEKCWYFRPECILNIKPKECKCFSKILFHSYHAKCLCDSCLKERDNKLISEFVEDLDMLFIENFNEMRNKLVLKWEERIK